MQITTPTEITSVAWEGELVAPAVSYAAKSPTRLTATIGRPEIWPVANPHPVQGTTPDSSELPRSGNSPIFSSQQPTRLCIAGQSCVRLNQPMS